MQMEVQSSPISVFGGYGFVGGEFCRQFMEEVIRIPKHEIVPQSNRIIDFISTTDNYNMFDSTTLDIETNLIHLMDVLDACHKEFGNKFEFNFISSWFVYGKQPYDVSKESPLTEESFCNPTGFYSITKRAAEQLLISYCQTFKIKYRILRLANVLGAKDKKVSAKKNALQFLLDKIVQGEDVELYDNGDFYRDYIDVRDCAKAIWAVIESGRVNEIYNISNGHSYRFRSLIEYAIQYSGSKSNIWSNLHKPEFHTIVQSKDVFLSNKKLEELGYKPEFSIWHTLEKIIDDYSN